MNKKDSVSFIFTEEMSKLAVILVTLGIEFTYKRLFDGCQIVVKDKCYDWDAICHSGSYGHETGLLEVMGNIVDLNKTGGDTVEGFLTANDILEKITKK
jgi:hypothetical protein